MYLSLFLPTRPTYFLWKSRHFNTFLVSLEGNEHLADTANPLLPQKLLWLFHRFLPVLPLIRKMFWQHSTGEKRDLPALCRKKHHYQEHNEQAGDQFFSLKNNWPLKGKPKLQSIFLGWYCSPTPWPLLHFEELTKNQVIFTLPHAHVHSNMQKVQTKKKQLSLTTVQ